MFKYIKEKDVFRSWYPWWGYAERSWLIQDHHHSLPCPLPSHFSSFVFFSLADVVEMRTDPEVLKLHPVISMVFAEMCNNCYLRSTFSQDIVDKTKPISPLYVRWSIFRCTLLQTLQACRYPNNRERYCNENPINVAIRLFLQLLWLCYMSFVR